VKRDVVGFLPAVFMSHIPFAVKPPLIWWVSTR